MRRTGFWLVGGMIGPVFESSLLEMLNLRVIPPRALFLLRTPSPHTVFRKQWCSQPGAHTLGCGRIERRCTSTSSQACHIVPSAPSQPPPKSWIERIPEKIRPYLYLARVDKPIGTLLLYYPCSAFPFPTLKSGVMMNRIGGRLVDNDGFVRAAAPHNRTFDIPYPLWRRRVCHARGGMYDQRYVGSEFG